VKTTAIIAWRYAAAAALAALAGGGLWVWYQIPDSTGNLVLPGVGVLLGYSCWYLARAMRSHWEEK
jgi:hypothetical protein